MNTEFADLLQAIETFKPALRRLALQLSVPAVVEGAVLYGSYAVRIADVQSDVDLLVVTSQGPGFRRLLPHEGRMWDVEMVNINKLQDSLQSRRVWRNNHRLLALHTGSILWEEAGKMQSLQSKAARSWLLGPRKASLREDWRTLRAVRKMQTIAVKLAARADECDANHKQLIDAQVRSLYDDLLHLAARLSGHWAYSVWISARYLREPFYEELRHQYLSFCALSIKERAVATAEFAGTLSLALAQNVKTSLS